MNDTTKTNPSTITPQALALLGGGKIAYLRPIRSEDLGRIFPHAPEIQPGLNLFALLGADGTPIVITDSLNTALQNAMEHDLTTVSVH